MGYRYDDKELAYLQGNYMEARRVADDGNAPIDPSRDDYEAIEFLIDLKNAAEELVEDGIGGDTDEVAESVVPYNNYKIGMVYAELGLWGGDYEMIGEDMQSNMRYAIFSFADEYISGEVSASFD